MRAARRGSVVALAMAIAMTVGACADDGPLVGPPGSTAPPSSRPATPSSTSTTGPTPATSTDAPTTTGVTEGSATSAPDSTVPDSTVPATSAPSGPAAPAEPRPPLTNGTGENEAFSGIGQLDGFGTSCTTFLLDVGEPSGPAYAMTNGHCVGLFDGTTLVRDGPGDGAVARFRLFSDTPTDVAEVPVERVLYATMRGTDVAVLELAATRSAVIGLASYALGSAPADGAAIRIVGVPASGIPADDQVVRGGTCTAGPTTRLVEFEWLWDAAIPSDCLGIVGGSSGSPVFAAGGATRVVGIVNTTTIGAAPGGTCYLGQPCELTAAGAVRVDDRTYAMPVAGWDDCFTPAWDPTAAGCPVEQAPVTVDAPRRAVRPGATWAAALAGGDGPLVVKTGPGGTTDCRDRAGYVPAPPGGRFDDALPAEEGVYVLCAAAVRANGAPVTGSAGTAVMVVDATPPAGTIALSQRATEDDVLVEPIFSPPELSSFDLKVGPSGATDCAAADGYAVYRRIPVTVAAADLPATLCVVGEDEAGNKGAPQSFELT